MIGIRNTVVHEYQSVNMKIVEKIITEDLADILRFTGIVLPYGM